MPYYRCTLVDQAGKKSTLTKEASSPQELIVSFNSTEHTLVRYTPVDHYAITSFKKNFKQNVILEFTEIMASLLKSGLTIQDAIALSVSIAANPKTVWLCKNILQALKNGLPLNEALSMHSPSFSPLYQSLVRLGEKTGSVASVFHRMSVYLRNEQKIRNKIGNVIWYPILVLSIAVIGCTCIIVFLLPRMAEIYTAFNPSGIGGASFEMAKIYRSLWISLSVWVLIVAGTGITLFARRTSERFAFITDYALLRMPVLGNFIKSIQTMDFSFAMEMLTGAGITVHSALQETAGVIRNRSYRKSIQEVHDLLVRGELLSKSFAAYKDFPPYIATWIAIGERTGAVEAVFTQIREYFQADVDTMSERLMGMLEPLLIVIVGIILIIMIIQFILPIFSLYGRLL
jgi:type II secretory pathway component PulF